MSKSSEAKVSVTWPGRVFIGRLPKNRGLGALPEENFRGHCFYSRGGGSRLNFG